MTFAAQAPVVYAMARTTSAQPNSHHHHQLSSSSASNGTATGLFDLSQLDGYAGFGSGGGSYLTPASSNVRSKFGVAATTQVYPPAAFTSLRVTAREDYTRVQLQKERNGEHRRGHVVGDRIPGFKTSAAFFASLRTNLRLHASPPSSPVSTPPSMRGSLGSLPPPSPLSGPAELPEPLAPQDPLSGVPELHSYVTRNEMDKAAALQLVADSIAQMRQSANKALVFHPLNLALLVGVLSMLARWVYDAKRQWSLVWLLVVSTLTALLVGSRWCTRGYARAADEIDWDWLESADVVVTKFGEEVIGAAVVDWISGESSRQKRKKAWRGEIRAWTVRLKYRGKGVGIALLEDVVKEARKKSAECLDFAEDHASEFNTGYCRSSRWFKAEANRLFADSKRILPMIYNSKFDESERKARDSLRDLLEASPTRGKRRRMLA